MYLDGKMDSDPISESKELRKFTFLFAKENLIKYRRFLGEIIQAFDSNADTHNMQKSIFMKYGE